MQKPSTLPYTFNQAPYSTYYQLTQTDSIHYVLHVYDVPSNGYRTCGINFDTDDPSNHGIFLFSISYFGGKWQPDREFFVSDTPQ